MVLTDNRKLKILLVDDSENVIKRHALVIEKTFKRKLHLPVEIFCAATGEEGVDLYREKKPDIVWMDFRLPGISGDVAIEQIREIDSSAVCLIVSGYTKEDCKAGDLVSAGKVDGYYYKGVNLLDVIQGSLKLLGGLDEITYEQNGQADV